ncbi:hypothetical protein M077_5162 [Bacteroides fragilis str. 2-F-2 |nr:hypothetical protein M077_5162 [Bacteroides fragilis str. 2-F-2 \
MFATDGKYMKSMAIPIIYYWNNYFRIRNISNNHKDIYKMKTSSK